MAKLSRVIRTNIVLTETAGARMAATRRAMMIVGVFMVLFGALFVWVATLAETVLWAVAVLGGLILAYGFFQFVRAYRTRVETPP